jgi:hypothetical protein
MLPQKQKQQTNKKINQFAKVVDALAENCGQGKVEGALVLLLYAQHLVEVVRVDAAEIAQRILVVLAVVANRAVVVARQLVVSRVHVGHAVHRRQLGVQLLD